MARGIPRGTLVVGVLLLGAAIVAMVLATSDTGGGNFASRAAAVCDDAQRELKELPQSPRSITEGLAIERSVLAIYKGEVSALQALGPGASAPFRAGLADDKALLAELSSMLARPDFVQLSLTLPGHPELVPPWLKEWLARTQALQADAHTRFMQAGIPACAESLGE